MFNYSNSEVANVLEESNVESFMINMKDKYDRSMPGGTMNKKRKALVLFDIDGTLVWNFSEHKEAFSRAFREIYHLDCSVDCINHQGMSDQKIAMEVLKKNGLKEEEIKNKLNQCMLLVAAFFEKLAETSHPIVLPGVKELLDKLQQNNIMLGLVTGNLEPIAEEKLKRSGLEKYFKVGGFGSDDMERVNLIKIAIKRASNLCGYKISGEQVYIVGDTPEDIKAAKEAKTKVIAVATGCYTIKDLEKFEPHYLFRDLSPTEEIMKVILENK